MSESTPSRVAVVGAGLSGLAAAEALQSTGARVTVFDKGRRPGGRMNTREHGERRFDHGAQYFKVRDETWQPHLDRWIARGLVAEWEARFVFVDRNETSPVQADEPRYVGCPGMIDVALALAAGLDVRHGVRIERVDRVDGAWVLADTDGLRWSSFDRVVVAVPAPQAVPLLSAASSLAARVAKTSMKPCWAAMLSFDRPLDLGFDAAFARDLPFSWIARNSSKPGRPPEEAWVVHFSHEWSRSNDGAERDEIGQLAFAALRDRFGALPEPTFVRAHRWGYALASEPLEDILYEPELGIGACGDWCRGGRVEGALTSGLEIARRLSGDPIRGDGGAAAPS